MPLDPLECLVNQVSLVMAPITPLDHMDLPSVELEETSDQHHPTSAPLVELEASAPPTEVDLEAPVPHSETQTDSAVLSRYKEHQTMFPDQALDWEAQARQADLQLPVLEQVLETVALPQ